MLSISRATASPLHPPLQLACILLVLLVLITWQSSSFQSFDRTAARAAARRTTSLKRLTKALDGLESTPILSYEDALAYNEETCEGRAVQSNRDQVNGDSEFWRSLTTQQLADRRSTLIRTVRDAFKLPHSLETSSLPEETARAYVASYESLYGDGTRGIVYTGGNAVGVGSLSAEWQTDLSRTDGRLLCIIQDTLQRVYASVRILRNRHHSKLPIEIFAFPEEMQFGPGEGLRGELEGLGDVEFKEVRENSTASLLRTYTWSQCGLCRRCISVANPNVFPSRRCG